MTEHLEVHSVHERPHQDRCNYCVCVCVCVCVCRMLLLHAKIMCPSSFSFSPGVCVCVCVCEFLHLLHTEYIASNTHSTSKVRTFFASEDILAGPYTLVSQVRGHGQAQQ